MLMLPKLIDDLEGRVPRSEIMLIPGVGEEEKTAFLTLVKGAECFQFGELPLEENKDVIMDGRPIWVQPEVTQVEQEAWDQGLIPLPAPICWFEYKLGGCRSGLLVHGKAGDISVQRVDYEPNGYGKVFSGLWVKTKLEEGGKRKYWAHGNSKQLKFVEQVQAHSRQERLATVLNLPADHYLAVYMCLMLCSRTTELHTERAPEGLNKARMKRGDYPHPTHRVVTIVPGRFLEEKEHQGGTHASPVLHWRRSHRRHFAVEPLAGRAVYMPEEDWNGRKGWWVTIIPRYLVGVADPNRDYSHEYRLKQQPKETTK